MSNLWAIAIASDGVKKNSRWLWKNRGYEFLSLPTLLPTETFQMV